MRNSLSLPFLLSVFLLLSVSPLRASTPYYDEYEDDIDMDEILEFMRRTRGRPKPPQAHPGHTQKDTISQLLEQLKEGEAAGTLLRDGSHTSRASGRGGGQQASSPRGEKTQRAKFRKDSIDADSLRTREEYQKHQADRVRKAFKEGKRREVLVKSTTRLAEPAQWDVPCVARFYDSAYGVVQGCTPSVMQCVRVVRDGFGSEDEMRDLAEITERAMVNLFHQGGTTSIAPASSLDRLGNKGSLLYLYFLNKIKLQLIKEFGLGEIYDSGALLTRLKGNPPKDEWDVDPNHVYWNPHVDKANIPTYDYSALLYLNTLGDDFEGGEFAFLDDDADRIVQPRAGRLLLFPSGPENLHQVREVTRGTRYVLAMWFTCSKQHQYTDDD
uniref:Fe2OG dioxygenase domain-containing protein n=2 Tax=Hemiselmis andersenii TaxID=464988 RepID=A0A7S1EDK5_HEMAN|mmetsp:Transcript_45662/g.111176  ORF Transcript_45662/g.111176 Transcript_45662/m.111176 type:complete len:384 (+) Transcript_45662:128-1279(+)|eukprot:CAMPEP_0114142918 /NCGR_PEP_ID=MMETSP0043_2-20121206/18705_1 /TAXON_ID=464988 /ORGANISM="Hemiselmis andersenii, Strain CCMP644" /LENGTH=383 /DNA_ID=CAMNT_0001237173 /DNA_START=68 /DNA_END=1219 /DNA_ORIENTATION=+